MDLEKVKQFLEENKEQEDVQEYLKGFNQISEEDYNTIVAERDDLLRHKPKDLSDEEKALQTKQQELWQREVGLTLKEKGLERFSDIINVQDEEGLNTATQALETALNDYKVDNAYIPTDHAQSNEYEQAKDKGDTTSMIKSLFGFK